MNTRAVLVMASYLDKKGLANVRGTYPELDSCIAIVQRMHVAGGSVNARASVIDILPPVIPPTTQPPTTGTIAMTTPVLNAPFTATVHFLDDAEVERPVDSVDWSATGAAHIDSVSGDVTHGIYNGTGAFEIDAVGHVAGSPDISVKVSGSVPVPFPTHGRIDLS